MLYEIRLLLEPYAIRTYGNRVPQNTYVDFYKHFTELLNSDTDEGDFELDDSFHQMFYNASQNSYLLEMNNRLSSQVTRLRILTRMQEKSDLIETTNEHLAIVTSCLQSNWNKAAEQSKEHLERSRENSFKLILSDKINNC